MNGIAAKAKAGDEGTLTVFLFTPDERQLSAKVTLKVEKAEEQPTTGTENKGKVQVPDPIAVFKDQWPEYGWGENSVAEVKDDGKDPKVFVNMNNRHLDNLLERGGYQEIGLKRMRNNFLLYVAFYAWAKYFSEQSQPPPFQGKDFDDYQQKELDRLAQTVVHSISASSRMGEEDEE
ncbi:hypothetical protein [Myxococcus qinghaiensis]|uniref:hypothetical protein n=1 Tax=Myxococcus qinghaiensis TaxID=2906758 RepID=UPI0020A74E29|nr:hypothetical protein [Myxococcus qinghaiensis]MCP3161805.1 hypothetical protein [Myxococcus qinghaiensis]